MTAFGAALGSVAQRSSRAAQSASDWTVSAAVATSGEANKNRMVKSLKVFMLLLPRGSAVARLALVVFLARPSWTGAIISTPDRVADHGPGVVL
jgi:hypothetical protein